MINKEVCKLCWGNDSKVDLSLIDYSWTEYDEYLWKKGFVTCLKTCDFIKINDQPDENCPYHLEHLLSI